MTRLADSVACELAQRVWLGIDAPGLISESGIRRALERGVPGDLTLEDVVEWCQPAARAIFDASTREDLESRLVGIVAAALIVGAKLQETNGS